MRAMSLTKHLTREERKRLVDAVEKEFERYDLLRYVEPDKLTKEDAEFCRLMEQAVERLPEKERTLISKKYLEGNSRYIRNYEVANFHLEYPISLATYATIRNEAFAKIALFLSLDTGIDIRITN